MAVHRGCGAPRREARPAGGLGRGIGHLHSSCCRKGLVEASSATGSLPIGEDARMPLQKVAWLATVAAALITALLLFLSNYDGYGLLAIAVGLCAAINLR
jgi:hypothetical protein